MGGKRKGQPQVRGEPNTGQHKDRQRYAEQLKAIDRDKFAQNGFAPKENAEHSEINKPKSFGRRRVGERARRKFGRQGRDKQRKRPQELQFQWSIS